MTSTTVIQMATLGSAATFAGQAAAHLKQLYPELSDPTYFSSVDELWAALVEGKTEAIVSTVETARAGFSELAQRVAVPGSTICVLGEAVIPYGCTLYAKPGTKLQNLRLIVGHGSLQMCTKWLDQNVPGVERKIHDLNSVEAAKEVAASDGTMAVVGSRKLPELVSGLQELARDIDDGATGTWWVLTSRPVFNDRPNRLVIGARLGGDGALGDLCRALGEAGFKLRTAWPYPSRQTSFLYDYLLTFSGQGERSAVDAALSGFKTARLAGAFRAAE